MNHAIVHFAACAAIESRSSYLSPLVQERNQPARAHSLLARALHGRHLEQYSMNATCAICDYLPPPILNILSRGPPTPPSVQATLLHRRMSEASQQRTNMLSPFVTICHRPPLQHAAAAANYSSKPIFAASASYPLLHRRLYTAQPANKRTYHTGARIA